MKRIKKSLLDSRKVRVEHLVLLKLKSDTSQRQIDALTTALLDMKEKMPGIIEIAAGVNSSPEGASKGYEYGFLVRFKDAASRDAYLPNPDHIKVVTENINPILEDSIVVDFDH
jgi:hypothetical protein